MSKGIYQNRLEGQTIRLLELLATDDASKILECRLIEAPLYRLPPYEALSYVWGDPESTEPITCNGHAMHITVNLARALRNLRFTCFAPSSDTPLGVSECNEDSPDIRDELPAISVKPSRVLWADAICINQQDVLERNHQVQLMKEVYSSATGVIVWLGLDKDGCASDAINSIKKVTDYLRAYQMVVKQVQESNSALSWMKGRGHFCFDLCESALRSHGIHDPWAALRSFFLLPWWSRVWCVQEVYLSTNVLFVYGGIGIEGKTVAAFTEWFCREITFENSNGIESKQSKELQGTAIRVAYNTLNHRNLDGKDLCLVCEDFRNLNATDARDKVYGLLGLWRPKSSGHPPLEVDYNKSAVEVYTDVVLQAIQQRKDLFILRFVDHETDYTFDKQDKFPSWVPRWDTGDSWQFGWLDKSPLSASIYQAEIPDQDLARSGVLRVKGVLFDRIVWISDVLESGALSFFNNPQFRHSFIQLYKEAAGMQSNDEFSHQISIAELATSVSAGYIKIGDEILDKDTDDPNAWLDISDLDSEIGRQFIASFHTFSNTDGHPGDPKVFRKMLRCDRKRLFRTSRGYLGLGRSNTREGDCVTVLHGGRIPHVLRLHRECYFLYVGDCYVYDIMDRQVYNMFEEEGVEPGVFDIH